jgi:hypothetical protein
LNEFGEDNDHLFIISHRDFTIAPGDSVKLSENEYGDYFRVINILKDGTLQGLRLRHNRHMHGFIPNIRGDLTVIVELPCGDVSTLHNHALVEVDINEVEGLRKVKLVAGSETTNGPSQSDTLICQMVVFWKLHGKKGRLVSAGIRGLKPEEADETFTEIPKRLFVNQEYSTGDVCHGPGGSTEGAKLAGFRPKWAVDFDNLCNRTYSLNNPETKVYREDLNDFVLKRSLSHLSVSLLLISVPCRYWSRCHTVAGEDDEKNKKLLFLVPRLIEKIRPRQVVIEQVDGLIVKTEHRPAFQKLIRGILAIGYNLSWTIVNFQQWGSCASRRRLVILASA